VRDGDIGQVEAVIDDGVPHEDMNAVRVVASLKAYGLPSAPGLAISESVVPLSRPSTGSRRWTHSLIGLLKRKRTVVRHGPDRRRRARSTHRRWLARTKRKTSQ
jgi:hypothetical protein